MSLTPNRQNANQPNPPLIEGVGSESLSIDSAAKTMSSREVAEIVEARHNDVLATIERLFSKGLLRSSRKTRRESTGGRPIDVYDLVERDCYLVVAGYSDEMRARLVDRWQELESKAAKPVIPDFSDPVAAARAWADAKEAELKAIAELEQAKPAVQFVEKFVDASTGSKGVREVAKLLNANEREFVSFLLAKQIMYRLGGRLTPYAPHLDAGRSEVKAGVADNDHAYTTSKFTAKGIQWIAGLWVASQIGEQA